MRLNGLNGTRFPISRVLLYLDGRNSFDRSKMDKRGEMDFFSLAMKIEKNFPDFPTSTRNVLL